MASSRNKGEKAERKLDCIGMDVGRIINEERVSAKICCRDEAGPCHSARLADIIKYDQTCQSREGDHRSQEDRGRWEGRKPGKAKHRIRRKRECVHRSAVIGDSIIAQSAPVLRNELMRILVHVEIIAGITPGK